MKFDPRKHHRASNRLQGHDYSLAGAYFVTIVTYQREPLFGEIMDGEMKFNRRGEIARQEWFVSANIRREIRLFSEEFVVMPNHVHGIVWIENDPIAAGSAAIAGATGLSPLRQNPRGPAKKSLSSFIAGFKSSVTKRIRGELNETGIWQRNYYDRIIRNDREPDAIRKYIDANPSHWPEDNENPIL